MTQNQISYWNLQETKRSNESKERETNRHNVATENESMRHNTVSENETSRHNLATEGESVRHNTETEKFNISQLQESQRHNKATENLSNMQLNESIRHNTVSEQQNEIANLIKAKSNEINAAYNDAIIELRSDELDLNREKEIQRISESQRDFNEAVRMNDAKLIIDAFDEGSDVVRTIFGNKGLVGAGLFGATVATTALKPNLVKRVGGSITKETTPLAKMNPTSAALSSPGGFDLFLVPNAALDIFNNTMYPRTNNTNVRWD